MRYTVFNVERTEMAISRTNLKTARENNEAMARRIKFEELRKENLAKEEELIQKYRVHPDWYKRGAEEGLTVRYLYYKGSSSLTTLYRRRRNARTLSLTTRRRPEWFVCTLPCTSI